MIGLNEKEFDDFYAVRYAPLVRLLFLQTGDQRRAEDGAQEAFLRAWQRRRQLTSADPVRWVTQVAFRLAVSDWRRSQRLRALLERGRGSVPTSNEAPEELVYVMHLLHQLPRKQRSVVLLHYFDDLSVGAIADILDIAPGTVKSRLSRAREQLRGAITKENTHDRAR